MNLKAAVRWIAFNDDAELLDVEIVKQQLTVVMVADLAHKSPAKIAALVVGTRRRVREWAEGAGA